MVGGAIPSVRRAGLYGTWSRDVTLNNALSQLVFSELAFGTLSFHTTPRGI